MKKLIQIILLLVIVALVYVLIRQILGPMEFQKEVAVREKAVVERLKDIRTAQRAYKSVHQVYTSSFDSLINFILTDSLTFEKAIGSEDDSVAVAKGLVSVEKFKIAAIDTVFGAKKLTPEDVKNLRYIPYGQNNVQFRMEAGSLVTESQVEVQVFECRAPFKDFLSDLDKQELVNMVDEANRYEKYAGLKVGSMKEATNDAGNWE